MSEAESSEWIAENDVRKALNVRRPVVREARPVTHTTHGNEIVWLKKDAVAFALSLGLDASAFEKSAAPAADGTEELTVASVPREGGWHYGHHHLITARRAVTGELVTVRVVDSRKYVPMHKDGTLMKLKARRVMGGNWWELVGREPRWKGVW